MTQLSPWQRLAAALSTAFALLLTGCETTPAFQVSGPSWRDGTVESIVQDTVQSGNAGAAALGGAVIGGLLGNQVGGGSGRTAATIIGAGGGALVGNQVAQRQTLVWRIGVRYDDGSLATIQQTTAPALRIGDRVRVTANGIELLRQGPN